MLRRKFSFMALFLFIIAGPLFRSLVFFLGSAAQFPKAIDQVFMWFCCLLPGCSPSSRCGRQGVLMNWVGGILFRYICMSDHHKEQFVCLTVLLVKLYLSIAKGKKGDREDQKLCPLSGLKSKGDASEVVVIWAS